MNNPYVVISKHSLSEELNRCCRRGVPTLWISDGRVSLGCAYIDIKMSVIRSTIIRELFI